MEIFKKWWIRFIISAVSVGAFTELFVISTGNELPGPLGFILILVIYLILSVLYGFHLRKK
jgi:hypothetical protein